MSYFFFLLVTNKHNRCEGLIILSLWVLPLQSTDIYDAGLTISYTIVEHYILAFVYNNSSIQVMVIYFVRFSMLPPVLKYLRTASARAVYIHTSSVDISGITKTDNQMTMYHHSNGHLNLLPNTYVALS